MGSFGWVFNESLILFGRDLGIVLRSRNDVLSCVTEAVFDLELREESAKSLAVFLTEQFSDIRQ